MSILSITPEQFNLTLKDIARVNVQIWISPVVQDSVGKYKYAEQVGKALEDAIVEKLGSWADGADLPTKEVRRVLKEVFGRRFSVRRIREAYQHAGDNLIAKYKIASLGKRELLTFVLRDHPALRCITINVAIIYDGISPDPYYEL